MGPLRAELLLAELLRAALLLAELLRAERLRAERLRTERPWVARIGRTASGAGDTVEADSDRLTRCSYLVCIGLSSTILLRPISSPLFPDRELGERVAHRRRHP